MKTKVSIRKFVKYLRDFSIVVAGIAVTLGVQDWLAIRNEKKDTALYLNTLKLELEDNCTTIDSVISVMEETTNYARYITTHDAKSVHPDTMQRYLPVYNNIMAVKFNYDAFEMFKTSGNMRFMVDKEALRSIWSAYGELKILEELCALYSHEKLEALKTEMQMKRAGKPIGIPLYDFSLGAGGEIVSGIIMVCKDYSLEIKEVISDIEKLLQ
ncbi:MAG: hypothetical protein LBK94_09750 [Prevotellaceae bacterium]|jgi:hypothetical protein|nr:hypothetical protein [Prevotellaceae bacterium]